MTFSQQEFRFEISAEKRIQLRCRERFATGTEGESTAKVFGVEDKDS